jgi:hypothetical protein
LYQSARCFGAIVAGDIGDESVEEISFL